MKALYEGIKEMILAVATDVIREESEERHNVKEIREELEQYIERERALFENTDMETEIDFHNLEAYIRQDLWSDFKDSLCGSSEQRKVKKENIAEKLYRYSGAQANGKKKQYIDKILDGIYDILGNYLTWKIPVEQRYIRNKEQDEIMEALSEQKVERQKEHSEQKAFREEVKAGLGQISQTLKEKQTQQPFFNGRVDSIYRLETDKFLKKRYQKREKLEGKYKAYSDFFKLFVEVTEEEKGIISVDNFFDFVKKNINENVGEDFIKICGPDGTGKSSFLMILYQYLYECFLRGEIKVYPFYIDLHYYEWKVVEVTGKEELRKAAEKLIRKDLEAVAELGRTGVGLLFMIDGNDNYFRTDLKPGPILESVLEDVKEDNIKIICIGEKANVQPRRRRKANQFIERVTSYTFRFRPVYIGEQEKCKEIIERYCELEWKREKQNRIAECVRKFNIKEIDYNLLTIFQKCSGRVSLKDITSLNGLYNRYCMIYLNGDDDRLRACEQMAYLYFMTDEWIEQEFIARHKEEWELVHQHKSLSNYLIACYYADIILNCDESRIDQLENVFTNGINIFLKAIINEEVKSQSDALKGCKLMFAGGGIRAKSQAAYILGRIGDTKLQEDARRILEEQKELIQKNDMDAMDCFLLRTICVSLLNLGERDAGEEFLASLVKSPVMNEVNRAFYLQYYDDIKQQPETVKGEIINLKDDGKDSIANTVNVLLNYIEQQFNVESQNWSTKASITFQIHLFTLCSLFQVRIKKKSIKELPNKLRRIISRTLEQESANISDDMKTYLNMLWDDIEKENYSPSHIYDELYGVKDIERSGWCKKIKYGSVDVVRYENVAEHMYYAWLMGMLYLPETAPAGKAYKGYQKEAILRCLLTHDLAERYVGDKLPEETTQEHKIKENEWMHKIFMHDTYNEIANMDAYRDIWENFDLSSGNINGRIAKEIDIIQSIYQFCIYKKMGAEFPADKEEEWKKEKNNIRTEIGRKILKQIVLDRFNI